MSSKHDVEYYAEKAYQLYRDKSCSYRVLFDEEIFVNPLFSYDAQESAFHDDLNKDGDSCFTFVYNNDNHDNHNDDHIAGHSTEQMTTNTYVHPKTENLAKAGQMIDALLGEYAKAG